LFPSITAGLSNGVIGGISRGQTIVVELENQYAVSTALSNEDSVVDAIQRPDFVSILAGGGWSTVDHAPYERRIVPSVLRPENITRRQALNVRIDRRMVLRKGCM
jgi:hypothetical protein